MLKWPGRRKKILILLGGVALPALLVLAMAGWIVIDGMVDRLPDRAQPADVAVVLGNMIMPDGQPSEHLKARLDRALELYHAGLTRNVIVSGGRGREGFDEAAVMKRYLEERGVPDERVVADSAGDNTWLTARNAAHLMRERGWHGAIVVSQFFHLTRSRLALRRFGVEPVFAAHANIYYWRDVYSVAREVAALASYLPRHGEP